MPTAPMQTLAVASSSYPALPQVALNFEPDQYAFFNLSVTATEDIYVSFDGSTNHGILRAGTPSASLYWETKCKSVWFKQKTAGAAISVDVLAGTKV